MSRQIKVIVEEDGNVTIEAIGFRGENCTKATAELEKALGVVGKRVKKPEFYQQTTTATQIKAGG